MTPGRRAPNPLRRSLVVLLAFLAVVVYGTAGYAVIEHDSLLDAVFVTVTTITTVGLQVHPLDGPGEIFTITVIMLGVAAFLYTFGVIVEILSGGRWLMYRRLRRMETRLQALREHVIVCGYGRTGKAVV